MDAAQLSPGSPLTAEFETGAAAERVALAERVAQLKSRAADLHKEVANVENELEDAARRLRAIDQLLGCSSFQDGELRGRRLREVAVDLLERRAPETGVHYKDWYRWVREEGHAVGGRDPLATFLVSIRRSPRIEQIGSRTGRYRLCGAQREALVRAAG